MENIDEATAVVLERSNQEMRESKSSLYALFFKCFPQLCESIITRKF